MNDLTIINTVHFNPATGEIKQVGCGAVFDFEGWICGELDGTEPHQVKPGVDTVDLTSIAERPGLPPLVKIIQTRAH